MATKNQKGGKSANKKTSPSPEEPKFPQDVEIKETEGEKEVLEKDQATATSEEKKDTQENESDEKVKQLREETDAELSEAAREKTQKDESVDEEEELVMEEEPGARNQKKDLNELMFIVIPFKASVARSNELLYAVRAWEKHLPGCSIVVVGDKLPWFSNEIIHIPHKPTSKNPQIDVAQKLLAACRSDQIPEYFIVSNDDIYPVSPLTITDLDLHTTMGRLGSRGSVGSVYRQNATRTLSALKKAGISAPWDYATHTPIGVWKEELAEVINIFNATEEGHLITTLYFNTVWSDHRPILVDNGSGATRGGTQSYVASVFRNVTRSVMARAFAERKFINHNDNGWSSVEPFLKKHFSEKSRFEK